MALAMQVGMAQAEDGGDHKGKMHAKMQEHVKEADTNGDGNIDKAEFLANAEKRFTEMDKNADGMITPEERTAHRDEMRARWKEHKKERMEKKADQEPKAE